MHKKELSMLRLSKLTDYGTVILSYMARHPEDVYSVAETAAAVGVAPPTASKILKALAKRGLVQSRRGSKGGYVLSRPPAEISIAEIIDAMESPFGLTECGAAAGLCGKEDLCRIRGHWQHINHLVRGTLAQVTLSDMNQAQPPRFQEISRHENGKHGIQSR